MKKTGLILIPLGLFIILFSAIIPYSDIWGNIIENRIYFRGILLGGLITSIGCAAITRENKIVSSLMISLGGGFFALLFMSTYNLICDTCISTYWYFLVTFIVSLGGFIIILIWRLWLYKTYLFSK